MCSSVVDRWAHDLKPGDIHKAASSVKTTCLFQGHRESGPDVVIDFESAKSH